MRWTALLFSLLLIVLVSESSADTLAHRGSFFSVGLGPTINTTKDTHGGNTIGITAVGLGFQVQAGSASSQSTRFGLELNGSLWAFDGAHSTLRCFFGPSLYNYFSARNPTLYVAGGLGGSFVTASGISRDRLQMLGLGYMLGLGLRVSPKGQIGLYYVGGSNNSDELDFSTNTYSLLGSLAWF